jgi:hypothetical protein
MISESLEIPGSGSRTVAQSVARLSGAADLRANRAHEQSRLCTYHGCRESLSGSGLHGRCYEVPRHAGTFRPSLVESGAARGFLEGLAQAPAIPLNAQLKTQRASQNSCGTCICGCEMLIYLRALVLHFGRREVKHHT